MFNVLITFVNGSQSLAAFKSYGAAMDFCRDGISYSGNRVSRVELHERGNGSRVIWDIDWDAISKAAGLRNYP